MRVAFTQASTGNPNEDCAITEVLQRCAANIAHGRLEATSQLMQNAGDRALIGNLTLDTFRHELERVAYFRLEITIRRAACHRTDRTHAAIGFERAAIMEIDFTRAFFRTSQQR